AKPLPEAEVPKSIFQKFQNQPSRSSQNKLQEVSGPNSNDTNLNDPDISDQRSRTAGADATPSDTSGGPYIKPDYYS
ncbi:hypothetical protein ACJBW9_11345, partial [Streptococcus suis]